MHIEFLTTASDRSKCDMLEKSLIKHGWPYHLIIHEWKGFGSKIIETYNHLKTFPHITHFFYSDSYDSIVLGTLEEALSKIKDKEVILYSAERACYPHPELASQYPPHNSPWKFLNGGGWFASAKLFCEMYESCTPTFDRSDQEWATSNLLAGKIILDYNCDVFQTIGFCPESDFENIDGRILNTVHNTKPLFIHGNGHTPMDKYYELI
jgi:hypothetical protein